MVPGQVFKTRWFARWARRNDVSDAALSKSAMELNDGLAVAALGGGVFKKRVSMPGRGKRGGARTFVAFRRNERVFFVYGFAKGRRSNITAKELAALKLLAGELLGYTQSGLSRLVNAGELIEICDDG